MSSQLKIRAATHAGTWYSGSYTTLNRELDEFLKEAPPQIAGARVLVGPHAGYSYAGSTLAQTYKAFDGTNIKRVFILGPSHHVYFKNKAMTSGCDTYETPIGNIEVDRETISALLRDHPKLYNQMSLSVDEEEHSFEMHMPFLYKVSCNLSQGVPKVIPIMIGSTDEAFEQKVASSLKPYYENTENAFVISTDFCHWGSRFGYTSYTPNAEISNLTDLKHSSSILNKKDSIPIYKSIEFLDKKAMQIASIGSYKVFRKYLRETENTICGAKPLSILLSMMESSSTNNNESNFKWIGYKQSSRVTSPRDSSVSYASGYAVVD
ncbi:hypothetical protein CANARDRAFT_7140 [[Candida] arabinofermentans NRRL YB-2248]|uniref:MEMO1 family protein n=1 Tax=[Candida] arabinofermentans NRRL YB-2248 TaxID=983967 RepID=A0A1E4T1Y7_9ASCO|nr:hypothetical protein CANARDRAFT_7140 [[Candida] arabinofermentans NRRL YB-2248]